MSVSDILDPFRANSSNYGAATLPLSDHLPMAVTALKAMGASEKRITTWAHAYAQNHHLRDALEDELTGRNIWLQRLNAHGRDTVLKEYLPHLVPGIGAAAFHPAIRAAYAIERKDDTDLAVALESWEREFLNLPIPNQTHVVAVGDALASLSQLTVIVEQRGLISTRMLKVAATPQFEKVAANVPDETSLDTLALMAAAMFAQTGDFTALHVMTGTHAMRILAPYMKERQQAFASFWRAYAAACLAARLKPTMDVITLDILRTEATSNWPVLLARAIEHDDEHVIKATYTAWQLDQQLHDPIYQTAALRYIA